MYDPDVDCRLLTMKSVNWQLTFFPPVENRVWHVSVIFKRNKDKQLKLVRWVKFSADDILKYFFLFFPRKQVWHFMHFFFFFQNVKSYFLGKIRKIKSLYHLLYLDNAKCVNRKQMSKKIAFAGAQGRLNSERLNIRSSILYTSALRKHAYSNILKILPQKNETFQIKNSDIFLFSAQNIDCGYSSRRF